MTRTALAYLYESCPSVFVKERLGFTPDEHQREYLDSNAPEMLLLWCRQAGKTTSSAAKAVHYAIHHNDSLVLVASASQKQAGILQGRALAMIRFMHRSESWKIIGETSGYENDPVDSNSRLVRCAVMSLQLSSGSEIISVPASPDTVRGYSPQLIILDEAARIDDDVYDAIRPMRIVTHAQLIAMTSAGSKRGWFYDAWLSKDPGWYRQEVKATDCPRITPEWLAREKVTTPDLIYRREYENEFIELEGGLFSAEDIAGMLVDDLGLEPIARPWVPDDLTVGVYD